MLIDISTAKMYVRTGFTDMRKQINGLAIMIQDEMKLDPVSGHLFIFCGKTRRRLKILYWDRNGFCLWLKRLERDTFPWPRTEGEVRTLDRERLAMLLSGIDFWNAHEKIEKMTIK
jgi:transposase